GDGRSSGAGNPRQGGDSVPAGACGGTDGRGVASGEYRAAGQQCDIGGTVGVGTGAGNAYSGWQVGKVLWGRGVACRVPSCTPLRVEDRIINNVESPKYKNSH